MEEQKMGRLEVITGCMFSGKTQELIRRLERLDYAPQMSYLVFKPVIDDRYGQEVVATHVGRKIEALPVGLGKETMGTLITTAGVTPFDRADVIGFDEGNFFSDKLPGLCEELVKKGKKVIVAGLDLNFAGKPFGSMPTLLALADQVDKLQAVCVRCGSPATRTQRLVDGKPAPLTDQVIKVGGKGKYRALCRCCWEKTYEEVKQ